jgi:hypothetical protein
LISPLFFVLLLGENMLFRYYYKIAVFVFALVFLAVTILARPIYAAPSTSITIIRLAADNVTVNRQMTLTYQQMRDTLPVQGDGETHYYHQGPVMVDDPDPDAEAIMRWNEAEDSNFYDFGAVQGTKLTDLCDLIGGMKEGEKLKLQANDPWRRSFDYKYIYQSPDRDGPMVLCWRQDGKYPDTGFNDGMRVVWFADTSVNAEGLHVFGNWDWHETADEKDWYYNQQGREFFPTTSGISGKYISQITILSSDPPWWDTNGDRTCNTADIVKIGLKWGAAGAPGWIPEDVVQDGVINILDAVKVGTYWGKSY